MGKTSIGHQENIAITNGSETDAGTVTNERNSETIFDLDNINRELESVSSEYAEFDNNKERDQAFFDILGQYKNRPEVKNFVARYIVKNVEGNETRDAHQAIIENAGRMALLDGRSEEEEVFGAIERGLNTYKILKKYFPDADSKRLPWHLIDESMIDLTVNYQRAIESNQRLVISIANIYKDAFQNASFEEILQEGAIGLMTAVRRFNYNRGFKLSTYATWWINQNITRAYAENARTIRLPVHVHDKHLKITRKRSELENKLGRVPTDDELVQSTGLPIDEIKWILQAGSLSLVSLNTKVGDGYTDSELGDFIADDTITDNGKMIDNMAYRNEIERIFSEAHLDIRNKLIFSLYHGCYIESLDNQLVDENGEKIMYKTYKGAKTYSQLFELINGENEPGKNPIGGLSFRAIGRIVGVTGQRVNVIYNEVQTVMRKIADESLIE